MKKTLAIIWRGNKKTVVLLLSVTVVIGMMSPLILYCEQQVINAISLFLNHTSVLELVGAPFWGLIGAYICVYIFPVFTELLHVKLEASSGLTFHRQLIDKMHTIRYQCVEDKEVTDLYFRIEKNIDKVIYEFMRNFCDLIAELIGVVGSFTIISSVSVISGAVFLILFAILLFFADKSAKNFYQLNQEFSETERRVVYLDSVENTKPFACEKKLFGFTDYINHKRSSFLLSRRNAMRKYDYKYGYTFAMIDTVGYLCAIILMLVMLTYMSQNKISAGFFIAASHAAIKLNLTAQNKIRTDFNRLMEHRRFWKEYYNFLALSDCESTDQSEELMNDFLFESLEFCDVTFQYPNGSRILDHISFRLEKGKQYALVGENGAGKSTIVKLLLRLYDVNDGEILLNGIGIENYSNRELYGIFTAVFQDFSKYYVSVQDNIAFGEEKYSGRMEQVLRESYLKEWIDRQPCGIYTKLGEIYTDGVNVSGGEWQRIALARALYRNTPVILLDEPTSALDPIVENDFYNQFKKIAEGKTTLFITHRLASTKMVDEILVLSNGKIIERGSHRDLLNNCGLYENMYHNQQKWYVGENEL